MSKILSPAMQIKRDAMKAEVAASAARRAMFKIPHFMKIILVLLLVLFISLFFQLYSVFFIILGLLLLSSVMKVPSTIKMWVVVIGLALIGIGVVML